MSGKPAIFLDRDGTLNESVGYVNHPSRFRLYPWSVDAIRFIRDEGYLAVIVTNQSGVGRGFFSKELVETIHDDFRAMLEIAGTGLDGVYYCPHEPGEGCMCRKPRPGMLKTASKELDIDLEKSWMIGDTLSDLRAGWTAGTRCALVRTGFGEGTYEFESASWTRQPEIIGDNLYSVLCEIFWGSVG